MCLDLELVSIRDRLVWVGGRADWECGVTWDPSTPQHSIVQLGHGVHDTVIRQRLGNLPVLPFALPSIEYCLTLLPVGQFVLRAIPGSPKICLKEGKKSNQFKSSQDTVIIPHSPIQLTTEAN